MENTSATLEEIFFFLGLQNKEIANPSIKWKIHGESQEIKNMNYVSFENLTQDQITEINLNLSSEELAKFDYHRLTKDSL